MLSRHGLAGIQIYVAALDKQRRSIRTKIAHVDQNLKLFGYEGDPSDIAPPSAISGCLGAAS